MLSLKQHQNYINWLVLGFLFLLPWQTRLIWGVGVLAGQFWEYTSFSLFATELLLWLIILAFAVLLIRDRQNWYALVMALKAPGSKKRALVIAGVATLSGLALWRSPDHFLSYYYLFHVLEAACLFFCVVQLQSDTKKMQLAFWVGGVGQGILALTQFALQYTIGNKWFGWAAHTASQIGSSVIETGSERWLRAYGSFGSPNMLGAYLAVAMIVGVLLYSIATPRQKIFLSLGQLCVVVGLFFSFSRAAWLAGIVGLIIYVIITIREKRSLQPIITQSAIYLILIIALLVSYWPLALPRLEARGRLETRSISERTLQYAEAKRLFFEYPLGGVGPGRYTLAVYETLGRPASLSGIQPAHNSFLLLLVELGLPLFAVVATIGCLLIQAVWRANPLGLSLVSVVVVGALFDHFWWTMYTGVVLVWVIFTLVYRKNTL